MAFPKQKSRERRRSDAMLRIAGLALLLTVVGAAPAAAADSGHGGGKALANTALRGGAAPDPIALAPARVTLDEVSEALTGVRLALRGAYLAGASGEAVDPAAGPAVVAPVRREREAALVLPWISHGKPGLRLPVSERLAFAIGYRHVEGEDLWRRYAEAGSVGYDSHDFVVRAYWRF
jgi:hypothetical protein